MHAVRKQRVEIESAQVKDVLILSGDHIYRMDYGKIVHFHREQAADITLAVKPVSRNDASRFGILKQGSDAVITDFTENQIRMMFLINSSAQRTQFYLTWVPWVSICFASRYYLSY